MLHEKVFLLRSRTQLFGIGSLIWGLFGGLVTKPLVFIEVTFE